MTRLRRVPSACLLTIRFSGQVHRANGQNAHFQPSATMVAERAVTIDGGEEFPKAAGLRIGVISDSTCAITRAGRKRKTSLAFQSRPSVCKPTEQRHHDSAMRMTGSSAAWVRWPTACRRPSRAAHLRERQYSNLVFCFHIILGVCTLRDMTIFGLHGCRVWTVPPTTAVGGLFLEEHGQAWWRRSRRCPPSDWPNAMEGVLFCAAGATACAPPKTTRCQNRGCSGSGWHGSAVDPRAATVGSPLSAAGPDQFSVSGARPTHLLSQHVLREHTDQRSSRDTRRRPGSNSVETSDRISGPA